jgi:hypothetical protein
VVHLSIMTDDDVDFDFRFISTADMFLHHQLKIQSSVCVLDHIRNREDLTQDQEDLLDGWYVGAIEYEIKQGTLKLEQIPQEYEQVLMDKPHVLKWLLSLPPTPALTDALCRWYNFAQDNMEDPQMMLDVIWASEYYRQELIVYWLVDDSMSPAWFFLEYVADRGFNFNPLFEELCINFVMQESPEQREVIQFYKNHGAQVTEDLLQAVQAVPSSMTHPLSAKHFDRVTRRVTLVLEMLYSRK